jgi:hypothetical protein
MTQGANVTDVYDASNIQVIEPAENLYALIRQIKERPGFYFDAESISALYHFINGYIQACAVKNIQEVELIAFQDFHEFVRHRTMFNESTSGWRHMLLSYDNNDEAKALAMFFTLFEEFTALRQA